MNVSLTFCRFEPYCRFQWKVNDGWDKGERNFFSFPKSITIRPTTHYELTPEFFCFPEIFLNLNKFVLPGGDSFDIVIPKWSPNIFRFIEQHRHALESLEVRRNIHSWFDITFGYKLSGPAAEEALNVFNPLSYVSMDATESEISQKHKWAKACGTVPCQLFNEPHSPSIERGKFDPLNFVYTLNSDVYTETVNIPKEILQNSIHESFSQRKAFCVVTYDNYKSTIYKITEERQFVSQITMFRNEAKFSYISEKQLMCVTVCTNEIIIWSISNGFITNIIPIKKVNALKIDEDINSMFIGVGKKMLQYTLNGFLVREIEFDDEITAITCFGTGFSIFDKYAIVGHRNGKIRICSICFDTGEFMVIQEKKLSQCSIQNIKVDISLCEVSVYDWEFVLK
ncbi:Beige/BEACH domain containing protein [Histomonas meleagridis]|uniref:Beige/BEACH domain containing protein n=1 Tax=Histomonas meleagridis TaxID=135588 RepID=UPI00355A3521|nr:Beige/BEACH domain containing protein [Histomonas meleagridis]KAH0802032.1 Beige/BEACH domain containing protein [Histomonas meleagridis]